MKTSFPSPFGIFHSSSAFAAAVILFTTVPRAPAQDDTVTVSAAEFQRMVYSAHLLTQMDEKPELDAGLQVLLELERRNPHARPAALADVLREATARYRTNTPAYIRASGCREEILAAYLEAFRQVPARTNLVPATLQLLNGLMLQPNDYTNPSPAQLIHSGNQRLLAAEGALERRRLLLDAVTGRARGNATLAAALDNLLVPEILFSVTDPPAVIIGNTNSPLHDNLTMQTLLALSTGSAYGSLTVSSNQLMTLFTNETQTFWDAIDTNLALQAEFNQSQPDLLAYLTNQAAQADWTQRVASVQQGQARRVACSTAAILVHASLLEAKAPLFFKVPKEVRQSVSALNNICNGIATAIGTGSDTYGFGAIVGIGGLLAGGLEIFDIFTGQESPEEAVVREIGNTQILIRNLSANMNYRFDRVDQSLTTILDTLNREYTNIVIKLDAQGRQIAQLNGDVDDVRRSLADAQTDLYRLERQLFTYFNENQRKDLVLGINGALFYEINNPGPMSYAIYSQIPSGPENTFFTYATDFAQNFLSSPADFLPGDLVSSELNSQLGARPLDANLNYIKEFVYSTLGQGTAGSAPLANPRDWFTSAYAYAQLALENPLHFRTKGLRLPTIINGGENLIDFCRSLTFSGASLNSNLYSTLENYYTGKLTNFLTQASATEQQYASDHGFALNTWRRWSANAPRLVATATEVLAAPPSLPPIPREAAIEVAAGLYHSLALKADGTVIGWGAGSPGTSGDLDHGQSTIPPGLTNVAKSAAGGRHSLALLTDGTVVGWGDNTSGQTNSPAGLNDVAAIAAGAAHSLALKTDGTIIGWGDNSTGQTNVPAGLTNAVAIAAGCDFSLALQNDGTVSGWGDNGNGQTNVPPGLTNVVAIAAGYEFSLALQNDGTVSGWGDNGNGQTTVPASATNVVAIAAGAYHCLALKSNGSVVAWGDNSCGQTAIPLGLTHVQAVAAGKYHSLALKADGTVVAWGRNQERQCLVPPAVSWHGAVAEGGDHNLALRADGTVVGGGRNNYGQITIPASATNVVAIAAGGYHSLALRGDGSVVGWGWNAYGQGSIPGNATNVVAIAAGYAHSLALRADGSVVGWGRNDYGQRSIPPGATNVVAITAGGYHSLALRADGTVLGWGAGGPGTGWESPNWDQTVIPVTATNAVAIAAGGYHSLALRADGRVIGWGWNEYGQRSIPSIAINVVAIAAGAEHSLALRADGTVVGWGRNNTSQATGEGSATGAQGVVTLQGRLLTNGVVVAAGSGHSLALRADGTVVGWGNFDYSQNAIPPSATNVVAIAAGAEHSLALRADGTVVGWGAGGPGTSGVLQSGQSTIPPSATNVVAIAGGYTHSLALRADGTALGWGANDFGQATIPPSAANVVAIAAGGEHSLALRADGTVVGWGFNQSAIPPPSATNVVAIAGGYYHSLALRADGTVLGWGYMPGDETPIPAGATNVVAIAAGYGHSLALRADGTVLGWGANYSGQATIPPSATNVVAIAAGYEHSLALRADGTVLGWGRNDYDQVTIPPSATNVVAIAAGEYHSLFLKVSEIAGINGAEGISFVRAGIPERVGSLIQNCNQNTMDELSRVGPLQAAGTELSGAKALFAAVLELGLPYSLERDAVLHGFLYGSEPLIDAPASCTFLEGENAKLEAAPDGAPQNLAEVGVLRYLRFAERLNEHLSELAITGQPELPRLVGHTLRLLNLLREAWTQPGNSPPPTLEMWNESASPRLLLYGEPYARYTLQYRDTLNAPGWTTTAVTNLQNERAITPPFSGSGQRFYRAMLPLP